MTQREALLQKIKIHPVAIGVMLGFTKLTDIHNKWIQDMMCKGEDETLQAHRGSYKTTCVSIALALIMLLFPNDKILFMRKTNSDVVEVIAQVKKILLSDIFRQMSLIIWGVEIELVIDRADCIVTNLAGNDPRGTPQLMGMGTQASLTGKHFDRIFTDDIVNIEDRISRAERERTKIVYQELQNIKNRGGRIFNTGTPWHKDDAFMLMPNPIKWTWEDTKLITSEQAEEIKSHMEASLFSANYELKHIASEDVIFANAQRGADASMVNNANAHIDASYGGSDGTAFTMCNKKGGKYYVLGKIYHKHVDDVEDEIIALHTSHLGGRISCEDNGDKGYLGKSLRKKGVRTHIYHESMNKYLKITSYLKAEWKNVIFVDGTDDEYIEQILDYNENAEHDDCPDSLSCMIRELWQKKDRSADNINNPFL